MHVIDSKTSRFYGWRLLRAYYDARNNIDLIRAIKLDPPEYQMSVFNSRSFRRTIN